MPEETPSPNPTKSGPATPVASSPIDPLRPLPAPSWRDRLAAVRRAAGLELSVARGAAAVVVTLGVALGAFVILRQPPAPAPELTLPMASPVPAGTEPTAPGAGSSGEARGEHPAGIVVHAAGAVAAPGLYRLADGARVDDVVIAAGGPAPDAQLERLNLAAPVADGERVYVPRVGEEVPADIATGAPLTGAGAGPEAAADAAPSPVDLNTATAAELDTLPGVGPATAAAIISYREANGGFRSVEELLDVRGIGDVKLAELRDLVTV